MVRDQIYPERMLENISKTWQAEWLGKGRNTPGESLINLALLSTGFSLVWNITWNIFMCLYGPAVKINLCERITLILKKRLLLQPRNRNNDDLNGGNISLFEDRFSVAKLKGEEKLQRSLRTKHFHISIQAINNSTLNLFFDLR